VTALHEIERLLDGAIRAPHSTQVPAWLAGSGLAVYRNNLREGARKALCADYPVVERLVGAPCMRGLAYAFVAEHPSRAGDLALFGHEFPSFLAARYAATAYAYLSDVAKLERAIADCLLAPHDSALALATLANLSPELQGMARCAPTRAWRMLESSYPVLAIWRANQAAAADTEIRLDSGPAYVLIRRTEVDVVLHGLNAGEFAFFSGVQRGATLAEAIDQTLGRQPEFDLSRALRCLFDWQLVRALTTTEAT
jgi:hypothetical protein